MQYRPTSDELLEAIADLLGEDVLPEVPEHLKHRVRVAENLARILQREARLGSAAQQHEHGLLVSLLGHDGDLDQLRRELNDRLRHSDDEAFDDAAWQVLTAVGRQDLAIAKPGHDAWEGA